MTHTPRLYFIDNLTGAPSHRLLPVPFVPFVPLVPFVERGVAVQARKRSG